MALTFIPHKSISPPSAYGNTMGVVVVLANLTFLVVTTWKLMLMVDWATVKGAVKMPACFSCCTAMTRSACSSRVVLGGRTLRRQR